MASEDDKKGPSVKFPPPLIFLFLMIAAYGVHIIHPVDMASLPTLKYTGLLIVVLGFTVIILISRSFKRANTSIEPWKPTTAIISNGVYTYSRNPIYLALCLITIGMGFFLNSLWVLLSVIPAAVLVYYIAIKKEEAYLEKKFGDEYLQYKNKVRRWL